MKVLLLLLLSLVVGQIHGQSTDIKADIVIAIDSSSSLSKDSFNEVKTFVTNLLEPFTIGQNGVRVALYHVGGDNVMPFAVTHLNGVNSHHSFKKTVKQMEYDGQPGQKLNGIILDTSSEDFRNEGFRSDIDNHLFLYITGSADLADTAAIETANAARRAGAFGYITVAYKAKNSKSTTLKSIAGGVECHFTVDNEQELNGKVMSTIREKIISASRNGGTYC